MSVFMEGENDEAVHFKDEDLRTLQDQLEDMIDTTKGPIPVINIGARSLKALLARLEAAEAVLIAIDVNDGWCAQAERMLSYWRKACGK